MRENILEKSYRHETFGGYITEADFYIGTGGKANSKGSIIASKICADRKFDHNCLLNALARDRDKKLKEKMEEM